tara:strand:+ start:200 stop:457 length:258 start_codon:yes stop_codon:yes gene_type:complete
VNPFITLVLKYARPYMIGEVKKYLGNGLPDIYVTVMENNIDLLDTAMTAYADGRLTKKEKKALKATAKRMAENLPDMIDGLPTSD